MKLIKYFILAFILLNIYACGGESNADSQDETIEDSTTTETVNEGSDATPSADIKIDGVATARARIMAGIELEDKAGYETVLDAPATKQHYTEFNKQWANLEEKRLSKIRPWVKKELADLNGESHNLFYPFSGPDFLNAYEFFPNCDNYLMFGLEPNGRLADIQNMPENYLATLRNALAEIFERNYFITSFMSGDLWGKGVLPIINIFMARTHNKLVGIQRFYLDQEGKPQFFDLEDEETGKGKVEGIMIEFLNEKKSKTQKVYYFGTDVADPKLKQKMELVTFIKSFPDKITFIKSASYILHNAEFLMIRGLVLNETSAILQDDTGVRYKELKENGWGVQLYGKYARPVADFGGWTYQPTLQEAFQTDSSVKPLNFTFGYHWKTDNTSVLLCKKKK